MLRRNCGAPRARAGGSITRDSTVSSLRSRESRVPVGRNSTTLSCRSGAVVYGGPLLPFQIISVKRTEANLSFHTYVRRTFGRSRLAPGSCGRGPGSRAIVSRPCVEKRTLVSRHCVEKR